MVQYDKVLDCAYLRKLGWLGFCTFGTELPVTCADGVDSSIIGDASLMTGVCLASPRPRFKSNQRDRANVAESDSASGTV
jgi:hypothetical protein